VQLPVHVATARPVVLPYRPAGHTVQVDAPAREYWPATHCDAVADADPAAQAYPAVHGPVHDDVVDPPVPYRPASHGPVHWDVV
jgi:hypothetical protein